MKKTVLSILSAVVCVLMLSTAALAADTQPPQAEDELYISREYVNPHYAELAKVWETGEMPQFQASSQGGVQFLTTEEAVVDAIREKLVNRIGQFKIYYRTGNDFDLQVIWDKAMEHTGNPKEGDSLNYSYIRYNVDGKGSPYGSDLYNWTLTFNVVLDTTPEQELQVDQKVAQVLDELNLQGKSDYEKVCAIYDYICRNVTYDYENLEDASYHLKYTAYAALINGTSVCEGYAALFYRLALEAGVDARMIVQTDSSGGHAWNIARIGDLYYNLDSTWDAPRYHRGYEYFLQCDNNFVDHYPDPEFTTSAFRAAYPKSQTDYRSLLQRGWCGNNAIWELYSNGEVDIYGIGAVDENELAAESPLWPYRDQIQTVSIKHDVTAIGDWFFGGCDKLTQVTVPASVTAIGKGAFSGAGATNVIFLGNAPVVAANSFGASMTLWYDPDTTGWSAPQWNGFRAYPIGVDPNRNGLYCDEDGVWRYYAGGFVDEDYTGLTLFNGVWFYVRGGEVDWAYTGLTEYNGAWFYISGGMVDWNYTGLVTFNDVECYVSGGMLDFGYTGLVLHNDAWRYVEGGMATDYTGLVLFNGVWMYVSGGQVDFSYTGLVLFNGVWMFVSGGMVDWAYEGMTFFNGTWFYVSGGSVNWDYVGMTLFNGTWFYISGGMVDWYYTGLTMYNGAWFYISGGMVDWNYTGLVYFNGVEFYVSGGMVDWNYTGPVGDKNVVGGMVVA